MARSIADLQIEIGPPMTVPLVAVPPRSAPYWQNGRIFFKLCYKGFRDGAVFLSAAGPVPGKCRYEKERGNDSRG